MPYPKGLSVYIIWDEITYLLNSTKDLLSLALTCRTSKELIIPNHLYRHICCDIRRENVWRSLGNQPHLARCVRSLELVEESMGIICLPRALYDLGFVSYDTPITNENMGLLTKALSHMIHLKEFIWTHIPTDIQHVISISDLLSRLIPHLEGLSVVPYHHPTQDGCLKFGKLSVQCYIITRNSLHVHSVDHSQFILDMDFNSFEKSLYQSAVQMIISCPNLEDLSLWQLSGIATFYLIQQANWNKLKQLYIMSHDHITEAKDFSVIMTSFFYRHSRIESLRLSLYDMPTLTLPSYYLPKLRSMAFFTFCNAKLTSFLSAESITRLVHLECPVGKMDIDVLPRMDKLQSYRDLRFDGSSLESFPSFLLKTPNLRKICLQISLALRARQTDIQQGHQEEFFKKIVLRGSNLTHLFFDFPLNGHDNPESLGRISKILSSIRALKYLQVELNSEVTNLGLERDKNGHYSGYRVVTSGEVGGDQRYWGDFFFDLRKR